MEPSRLNPAVLLRSSEAPALALASRDRGLGRARPSAERPGPGLLVRAVLWDLDGTLVDSEALHVQARAEVLAGFGPQLPPGFHDEMLGISEEGIHAALLDCVGLPAGSEAWRDLKTRHYEKALSSGLALRETTRQAFVHLADRAFPMAVVSNALRPEIDLALAAAGLTPFVTVTISRDDVSQVKPDPEGYLAAARRLGVPPSDCLVVVDSLAGCKAGLAAGMLTVFHPQRSTPAPEGAVYLPPEDRLIDLIQPWPARLARPETRPVPFHRRPL